MLQGNVQAGASGIEQGVVHLDVEEDDILAQFGDLSVEQNRIRLIVAMVAERIAPVDDDKPGRLEAAFLKLPRGAVRNFASAYRKAYEPFREGTRLLLEAFQKHYVPEGFPNEPYFARQAHRGRGLARNDVAAIHDRLDDLS